MPPVIRRILTLLLSVRNDMWNLAVISTENLGKAQLYVHSFLK